MAAGVLGVGFLLWLLIATLKTETQKQTSLVPCLANWTLLATALHLVFMGGAGWLNWDDWSAAKGLPAMTLLAFGLALAGMALKPASRGIRSSRLTGGPIPGPLLGLGIAGQEHVQHQDHPHDFRHGKASLITVAVSMNCPLKFHPQLTSQK